MLLKHFFINFDFFIFFFEWTKSVNKTFLLKHKSIIAGGDMYSRGQSGAGAPTGAGPTGPGGINSSKSASDYSSYGGYGNLFILIDIYEKITGHYIHQSLKSLRIFCTNFL